VDASDPKEHALENIRRQKTEFDQELDRISSFVRSLSPHGLEILRNALPVPLTSTDKPELPAKQPQESKGRLGRLKTSKGLLKKKIQEAIQSLDIITSPAVHERLVADPEFQFSVREERREISSIAAWLRKFARPGGILKQTRSGKGRRPAEFRKT
jgi:hypothetical protein